MKKAIFVLGFTVFVSASSLAWCDAKVFQLGFTIPSTVTFNTTPKSSNQSADQLTQTQQLMRNNKLVMVTSIVSP